MFSRVTSRAPARSAAVSTPRCSGGERFRHSGYGAVRDWGIIPLAFAPVRARPPPPPVSGRARGPARDGPDREIQPGQPVREGETHLPGAENNVQAALTHRVAPARSRYVQAVPIVLFLCWLTDLTFRSVT